MDSGSSAPSLDLIWPCNFHPHFNGLSLTMDLCYMSYPSLFPMCSSKTVICCLCKIFFITLKLKSCRTRNSCKNMGLVVIRWMHSCPSSKASQWYWQSSDCWYMNLCGVRLCASIIHSPLPEHVTLALALCLSRVYLTGQRLFSSVNLPLNAKGNVHSARLMWC